MLSCKEVEGEVESKQGVAADSVRSWISYDFASHHPEDWIIACRSYYDDSFESEGGEEVQVSAARPMSAEEARPMSAASEEENDLIEAMCLARDALESRGKVVFCHERAPSWCFFVLPFPLMSLVLACRHCRLVFRVYVTAFLLPFPFPPGHHPHSHRTLGCRCC